MGIELLSWLLVICVCETARNLTINQRDNIDLITSDFRWQIKLLSWLLVLSDSNHAIVLITSDFGVKCGKKFNNQPPCTAVVTTDLKKSLSPKKKKIFSDFDGWWVIMTVVIRWVIYPRVIKIGGHYDRFIPKWPKMTVFLGNVCLWPRRWLVHENIICPSCWSTP